MSRIGPGALDVLISLGIAMCVLGALLIIFLIVRDAIRKQLW